MGLSRKVAGGFVVLLGLFETRVCEKSRGRSL